MREPPKSSRHNQKSSKHQREHRDHREQNRNQHECRQQQHHREQHNHYKQNRSRTERPTVSRRLKWAAQSWLISILCALVLSLLLPLILSLFTGDAVEPETVDSIEWSFVVQIPVWLGMLSPLILLKINKVDWREHVGLRLDVIRSPLDVVVGIATGVALQMWVIPLAYELVVFRVVNALSATQVDSDDLQKHAQELVDKAQTPMQVFILLLIAVLIAPVLEEMFYRGFIQKTLEERFTPAIAVMLTAPMFALAHFQVLQFPGLVIVGVVCGLMLQYTKRIGMAICCHMSFNAYAVIHLL